MKKLFSIFTVFLFSIIPFISLGYYQSCSSIYGYGAIDAGNGYCKCMNGYTRYGNNCISLYSYCQNLYGYNATYDSLYNSCKCNYGYVMYEGQCIMGSSYCYKIYGYNSRYNSLNKTCECNYGYGIYLGTCQSYDTICQKEYGYNYHYNSLKGYCEVKNNSMNITTNNKNNCKIKGNVSYNGGEKIYHVPGCPNYNQTKIDASRGERWFCSEAEARAAGWRKAKNCP